MNTTINEKLKELKNEDFIWIVSFFLVFASIISNQYERDAILQNNPRCHTIAREIKIVIFIIVLFVYLYFVFIHWRNIEAFKRDMNNPNNQDILTEQARLIASLLFLIGGLIYLVTEIQSFNKNELRII